MLHDFDFGSLGEHLFELLFDFRIEAAFNLVRIEEVMAAHSGRKLLDAEPEFVKSVGTLDRSQVLDQCRPNVAGPIGRGEKTVGIVIDIVGLLLLENWIHLEVGEFSRNGRASLVELNLLSVGHFVRHFACRLGFCFELGFISKIVDADNDNDAVLNVLVAVILELA